MGDDAQADNATIGASLSRLLSSAHALAAPAPLDCIIALQTCISHSVGRLSLRIKVAMALQQCSGTPDQIRN